MRSRGHWSQWKPQSRDGLESCISPPGRTGATPGKSQGPPLELGATPGRSQGHGPKLQVFQTAPLQNSRNGLPPQCQKRQKNDSLRNGRLSLLTVCHRLDSLPGEWARGLLPNTDYPYSIAETAYRVYIQSDTTGPLAENAARNGGWVQSRRHL